MPNLPSDWSALLALVFVLGLRHGIDADHIATIDALTRLRSGRRAARWCGALFALGHGSVVLMIVGAAASRPIGWRHWARGSRFRCWPHWGWPTCARR